MARVVTLGETMALFTAPHIGPLSRATTMQVGVAGAESNVAIGLARLGVRAHWVGRVGDDEFGRLVATTVRGQDVHTTAIVDPEAPTGLMFKERRTATATRVRYYRAGSAGSRLCPDDVTAIGDPAVVHLSGITPALSSSAREAVYACVDAAHAAGALVSFDLNYRSALWPAGEAGPVLADLAARADILFATEDEARLVVHADGPIKLATELGALGPGQVIVKRGEHGAVALIGDVLHEVPAEPVVAVDPVGAGDAFTAGYLSEVCRDADAETRLRTAALAGAFAVTVHGDWEGAPNRAELSLVASSADNVRR